MSRALSASACTPGSARARSSSACSDASSPSRSNTVVPPSVEQSVQHQNRLACGARQADGQCVSGRGLLAAAAAAVTRGLLAEAALEPGDAATGVQNLLLAGVERVASRADVGVDLAVGGGAPGHEGVPAAAGHRGGTIVRVNLRLHVYSCLVRSPGRQVTRHGAG